MINAFDEIGWSDISSSSDSIGLRIPDAMIRQNLLLRMSRPTVAREASLYFGACSLLR
jgi:hypothetical protein